MGDREESARLLVNLARVYNAVSASTTALEHCYKALRLSKQSQSQEVEGLVLNTLGNTYREIGNLTKAKEMLFRSLATYQAIRHEAGVGIALANLGTVYRFWGRDYPPAIDTALLYYQQSLVLREKLRDTFGLAINYALIGLIFDQRKQYDTAMIYYNRSLELKRKNQDMLGIALTLNDMSKISIATRHYGQALSFAHEALSIASRIQALGAARGAAEQLVQLYRRQHQHHAALQYYDTVMYYSNLLITANKEKEYARMEALLKLENVEQENSSLRTEQKLKEAELRNTKLFTGIAAGGTILAVLITLGAMVTMRRIRLAHNRLQEQQGTLIKQEVTIRENNRLLSDNNELLSKALQEKDELMSIVVHDLQNPLTGISLILQILKQRSAINKLTNEYLQARIDNATHSVERMQELIRMLLSDHAVQAGAITQQFSEVDVGQILVGILRDYEPRAHQKGISLRIAHSNAPTAQGLETSLPQIRWNTDQRMVHDIVENLVSNAIKYSHAQSTVRILYDCADTLVIMVADEGQGISEAEQKHLFKRFSRLSTKPTAGEQSTGLGLSIVKRYVDLLGGIISVKSEVGKGSIFSVALPREVC